MAENENARWQHGLVNFDKVYGAGTSQMVEGSADSPFVDEIVKHLFGEVWLRPGLTVRDRRLLVIGATAMLGRPDLVTVQVAGAIANGELTDEQLAEIPLMMLFYAGAGNATALFRGIEAAKEEAKKLKAAP